MIFVTVGSMLPFDRLIETMDAWASCNSDMPIFAQIGDGAYLPTQMPYERMLTPTRFREINEKATLIVAHAGMGSVITASELAKPIVLVPRLASRKEHTTDHQVHTARWLRSRPGIFVVESDGDLDKRIKAACRFATSTSDRLSKFAPTSFTDRIHAALLE